MSKKYHEQHPTISFRCRSIEEYEKIKQMVNYSGKSESDYIRDILLGVELKESKSYNTGFYTGVNTFIVPCVICGKDMLFTLDKQKEIQQKIIETYGKYGHPECIKKKQG
jgi:Mobilization protein NikA